MITKRFKLLSVLFAAAVTAVLPFSIASAQSPKVQAARDAAQVQINKVVSTTTPAAVPIEDFATRRATAISIVNLTVTEATDAATKLDPLQKSADPMLAQATGALTPLVRGYQAYAQLLQTQLKRPTLTDDQLSQIAGSLGEWRKEVYDPGMRQALDALLLSQGADVLATASHRFEKIKTDVLTLQRMFGSSANVLTPHLELAKKYIGAAADSFDAAHVIFSDNQDSFTLHGTAGLVGTLTPMTFSRGTDGDFTCILAPTDEDPRACAPAFKNNDGYYYSLVTAAGTPISAISLGEMYRVSGQVVMIKPTFAGDALIGTMFVQQINRAETPAKPTSGLETSSIAANALESLLPEQTKKETVQTAIAAEVKAITKAYNEFFVMTKLAKTLSAK